jgi:hypothetical protein
MRHNHTQHNHMPAAHSHAAECVARSRAAWPVAAQSVAVRPSAARSIAARSHAARDQMQPDHMRLDHMRPDHMLITHVQPDPLLPQRNSACDVRHRACGLAIYCLTREGKGVAVAQASGRGRELTRKLPSLGRVGHLGCAMSRLLWHTLSLQRISMAPCLRVGAPAVERVCGSG